MTRIVSSHCFGTPNIKSPNFAESGRMTVAAAFGGRAECLTPSLTPTRETDVGVSRLVILIISLSRNVLHLSEYTSLPLPFLTASSTIVPVSGQGQLQCMNDLSPQIEGGNKCEQFIRSGAEEGGGEVNNYLVKRIILDKGLHRTTQGSKASRTLCPKAGQPPGEANRFPTRCPWPRGCQRSQRRKASIQGFIPLPPLPRAVHKSFPMPYHTTPTQHSISPHQHQALAASQLSSTPSV